MSSIKKPKRARSAYIFFCIKMRPEAKKQLDVNSKSTDIIKKLAEMWKTLKLSTNNDDIKILESFKEEANIDKLRYEAEVKGKHKDLDWDFLFFLQNELSQERCPSLPEIIYFIKNSLVPKIVKIKEITGIYSKNELLVIETLILVSKLVVKEELVSIIRSATVNSKDECVVCYNEGNNFEWPCHKSHITCEQCTVEIIARQSSDPLCPLCRVPTNKFWHYLDDLIFVSERYLKVMTLIFDDLMQYVPYLTEESILELESLGVLPMIN